jgi:hypothetical protein
MYERDLELMLKISFSTTLQSVMLQDAKIVS